MNISIFLLLTVVLGVVVNVNVVTATNQVGSIMLKGNKYNPAITTLESGLQYKIVRSGGSTGTGEEHPTLYSPCKINYIGKTLNSKIFDSSSSNFVYNEDMYHLEEEKEIASSKSSSGKILAPYQVIVCLQEAMQLMVVGDKWSLYCPSELAYGDIGSNEKNIYPGDMLMYDLELLEIFAAPVLGEDGSNTNEILEILPPVPMEEPPPPPVTSTTDTVVEVESEGVEDRDAPDSSSLIQNCKKLE